MIPSEKSGLLNAFLGGLPGQAAARLAMAVEADRLADGHSLPHDDILSGLRPVLRRENYKRTPTPLRLLCRPFQDLLSSAPRTAKQKGIIARSSLMPMWDWLHVLDAAETERYARETKALLLAHRADEARACAAAFAPVAAAALADGLADRAHAETLLGSLACADVEEIALLLPATDEIAALQELLAIPPHSFGEQLVWQVREIYDAVAASHPDAAPYIAVITMNRLQKPWEALRLPLLVTRHTDEVLISKTDMGLVGEILFARMDSLKASIQAARHPLFDTEVLMSEVKIFADLSSHIVKEIEIRREGEWGKRLLAERVEIGRVMEGFMDRAPREFAAALPMHKASGADFSRPVSADKREMALRYARLVTGSRNFAAAASFGARQKAAAEDLSTLLKRYNEDLIRAMKVADPAQAEAVATQFQLCVELTGILFSEEEAELLRRRARAAQAAAAA